MTIDKLVEVTVWKFKTPAERDEKDVGKADHLGKATSFDDLVYYSQGGGYLAYTTGLYPSLTFLSYEEVAALFKEMPWVETARKLGIWDIGTYLYYRHIFPQKLTQMTPEQYKRQPRAGAGGGHFNPDYHWFYYITGEKGEYTVARAHMSGIPNGDRVYIWIQEVIFRGANAEIAAGTTFVANSKYFYLSK